MIECVFEIEKFGKKFFKFVDSNKIKFFFSYFYRLTIPLIDVWNAVARQVVVRSQTLMLPIKHRTQ